MIVPIDWADKSASEVDRCTRVRNVSLQIRQMLCLRIKNSCGSTSTNGQSTLRDSAYVRRQPSIDRSTHAVATDRLTDVVIA